MNLANKSILITGATGGLGAELAMLLAEKGANIALAGRNVEKLEQLKASIVKTGSHAITIAADINQKGSVEKIIDAAQEKLGDLDIVIFNAGVMEFIELENQAEANIEKIIQTNVTSLIKLSRYVLKRFKQQNKGYFVFIGSIFGSLSFPHFATYSASKFAVHGFSQALRRELVNTDIGVTYIAPRGIKTTMTDGYTREMFEKSGNTLDTPEKVAGIIVKALEKEKQEVFIGQPQSLFAWLNGLSPRFVSIGLKKQPTFAKTYLDKMRSVNAHD